MSQPIHVVVLYGGQSTEHEISCRSASFVLSNLDRQKYDVTAVGITKDGRWFVQDAVELSKKLGDGKLTVVDGGGARKFNFELEEVLLSNDKRRVVVFPVMHGTYGEDGTLQGFLDLMGAAYVGNNTVSSSVGIDKVIAKRLVAEAGLPIIPYVAFRGEEWEKDADKFLSQIEGDLSFPAFVKPACLGSSVGVTKAHDKNELRDGIEKAFQVDEKVLIEKGLNVREIEFAVMGGVDPGISHPGEVGANTEFYTYESKYIDEDGADIIIPADLTPSQASEAKSIALGAWRALDLYGLSRVDLFMEKETGEFYFNEVNTIPGFTEISQFPLLWQEWGMKPAEILDRLVELALKRRDGIDRLNRSFY